MNREPKVVILDTSNDPLKMNNMNSSLFDDSDEENGNEEAVEVTENTPPGPIKLFFINNKGWLITIAVLLLTITALSLTIYFVNIKCNATVREERERTNKMIAEMEEQSGDACSARDKYCEEAQRLRSQLRELSEEYDRLKNAPPPKAVNKLQQKKILQEYAEEEHEHPRPKKSKKVTFNRDDEAISVDLPKPSSNVRRSVEEAVINNPLNGAHDMDAVVTAPDEEFDEDVIDM
jgi:hypothetical protein